MLISSARICVTFFGSANFVRIFEPPVCIPSIMTLFRSLRRQHNLWRLLIVGTVILSLHCSLCTAWLFSSQAISVSNGTSRNANAAAGTPHQDWYADLMHLPPDGTSGRKIECAVSTFRLTFLVRAHSSTFSSLAGFAMARPFGVGFCTTSSYDKAVHLGK
jgi:hypothetical protein